MNYEPLKNDMKRNISYAVIGITALIVINLCFAINDAGERTVVQYPTGTLFVKFTPGIYFKGFGSTQVYWDVVT